MFAKKLILLILLCVAVLVLLYICKMLAPLLDDVWKVLAVGITVGAVAGFYTGYKWREEDVKLHRELNEKLGSHEHRL